MLTALVGSALPGPGSSIRATSVKIKGALPIGTVMTARPVVREKRPDRCLFSAVSVSTRCGAIPILSSRTPHAYRWTRMDGAKAIARYG